MYFNIYALPVIFAGIVMLVLSLMAIRHLAIPGVKCFLLLMMAGTLYSVFYSLEISSTLLPLVSVFYKLEYLGIPFIPAFYLTFAIRYSGKKETLKPAYFFGIFTIPILTVLMVFTNSFHQLFISETGMDDSGLFPVYGFTPGIWYWIHQAYSIISVVMSFVFFLRMLVTSAPVFRPQVSVILAASSFPFIIYIIYLLGLFPWGLDPVPFAFAISGIIFFIGISRFNLFRLAPLARNLLFEKIPHAVIVFDNYLRIIDCNKAAMNILGIHPKDIGKPAEEIFKKNPDYLFILNQKDNKSQIISLNVKEEIFFYERLFSPLLDNKSNEQGKMLLLHDVTKQRNAETHRKEIEEKFRLIFERAPIGVIYFDKDGILKVCNEYFVRIIGSSFEKLIGLNLLNLPDQRVVIAVRNVLKGIRSGMEGEYHSVTGNKITPVKVQFESILDEYCSVQGGIGIIEDITASKEAEDRIFRKNIELQKLNAEKDRFFSIIAHDLRSPFNSFLGYTELMTDESDNLTTKEIRQYAMLIRKSAVSLFGLLENLLEWARLQQNNIKTEKSLIALSKLISGSIHVLDEVARKKEITITNNIEKTIEVHVDEKMISSVFRNLISNAIKFTPHGGRITINAKELPGNFLEVRVSDTGIGIPVDHIPKLFRIDEKISAQGTDNEPSTGLGLILCKEFVEKHGGQIRVESKIGHGSDFYFTIPMKRHNNT